MKRSKVQEEKGSMSGKERFLANFEMFEKSLNGDAVSYVHKLRKSAIARFAELGFPTTHDEEWKYTDVSPLTKIRFTPAFELNPVSLSEKDIEPFTFDGLRCHRLVVVNGRFSPELSSDGQ